MTETPGALQSIPESLADEVTRQKLAKARKQTRTRLAKKLDVSEETIRRSMKRVDLYFSTMREYLQRRGGNIWLEVRFPEQASVVLAGLSGNEAGKKAKKATGKGVKSKAKTGHLA
jgi:DeoR/GlpR family transcriptional regulator of sugar metabolism